MEGCAITLAVESSVSAVNLDQPSSVSVLQLRFVKEITPHHTVPKMDHLLLGLEKCGVEMGIWMNLARSKHFTNWKAGMND